MKMAGAANSLLDFMFYGVLDKFPRLKVIFVEFERPPSDLTTFARSIDEALAREN